MSHSRSSLVTLVVAGLLVGGSPAFTQIPAEFLARADAGDAEAQWMLGVIYDNGEGVPEDDAEAVRWYRLAAAQGFGDAWLELGQMYRSGWGVPKDDVEAVRWYRLASDHPYAQWQLGVMYSKGEGVPENAERAYMWLSIAAAGRSGEDRDSWVHQRDLASAEFTPEQLSRAQALATTCFNSNFTDCGEPE